HRALSIIFMRLRITEIDQHAVAHVSGDEAIEPGDDFGDGAVVGGDDLAQILWIESRRQLGRADEVAEHHRQLPAFGIGGRGGGPRGGVTNPVAAGGAARSEAIAARSLRRWPTEATPMLIRSSDVSSGSTSPSISLSRNAGAYRSSPTPRSHATTSMR